MSLQLSGNSERGRNQYELFEGRPIDKMPVLIKEGYSPASVAVIVDRRLNAPEEVRPAWNNNYFWTADGTSTDKTGIAVLTLDASPLIGINSDSVLYNGALQLDSETYNALKKNDASITLSANEVSDAHGKGLLKQGGIWQPANSAVGKAIGHWLRGKEIGSKDFQQYAQMVSNASGSSEVFRQYFDQSKPETSHLRSVVVDRAYDLSDVGSYVNLGNYGGRLVGVAPEAPFARAKELEARVTDALEAVRAFEFNGTVYAPVSGVQLK